MPDMDLREVLYEEVASECDAPDTCEDGELHRRQTDRILARLSRPDVLDEFERRVNERGFGQSDWSWDTAEAARKVLADMLGGGS